MTKKVVYVVYTIEDDDLGVLRVFKDYIDAKYFVKEQKAKGINLNIWEQPLL